MTRLAGRAPIAVALLLLASAEAGAQFPPSGGGSPFGAPPQQQPPPAASPFGAPPTGQASPFAPPPRQPGNFGAPGGAPAADPFSALRAPPGGAPGQPAAPPAPSPFGAAPPPPGPAMPGGPFAAPGGGRPAAPSSGVEHARLPPGVDQRMLEQLSAQEKQDFGVRPPRELHGGQMHAPTPTTLPGGRTIDTLNLLALLNQQSMQVVIIDALGGQAKLPNAVPAPFAGQSGTFRDQVQQQYGQLLRAATGGNNQVPLIVYCLDPNCWLSYNASVRAVKLGYQNVFWYRGGIWAWQQAGLPVEQGEQQQPQQRPQQPRRQ